MEDAAGDEDPAAGRLHDACRGRCARGIGGRYLEDANEARIIANDAEPGALTVGAGVREWALDPAAAARLWDVSLAMLAEARAR